MKSKIMPQDKFDLEACKFLALASDKEVIEVVPELLEWVQDINWPVALPICNRLANIGSPLESALVKVFRSDDPIWKFNLISNVILKFTPQEISQIDTVMEYVLKLVDEPTELEKAEGLNLIARDVIFYHSHCV